jgi:tetratricopeptide (TPR) repeat protein
VRLRVRAGLLVATALVLFQSSSFAAGVESKPSANQKIEAFAEGKKAIDEKRWATAIEQFNQVLIADSGNADAYNFLGLAYRWQNRLDEALKAYSSALAIDPSHLGANEYLGQTFLKMGDKARALSQLNKLKEVCGSCREANELASAISADKN